MLDGTHALTILKNMLRLLPSDNATSQYPNGRTYPNLFDAHPPFQIDGNFAATSGITEMLLRSDPRRLTLLPALPEEWADGSVSGLRGMGCTEVSLTWREGRAVQAKIIAGEAAPFPMDIYLGSKKVAVLEKPGETILNF